MKVLYATDGFDPAIDAGQVIEKVADPGRVEVTVISVTHAGIPAPAHAAVMLDDITLRRKDTTAIVDAAAEKLGAAGFRARGRTAEGHPGEEIVRAVAEGAYDLVVLGSGRRSRLGNRLLGSVSSYVLHSSQRSVLIVHETPPGDDRARLLLGTDGSRGADCAMQTIEHLADRDRTAIDVVSVAPPPAAFFVPAPGAVYVAPEMVEHEDATRRSIREEAERCADRVAAHLRESGFDVRSRVAHGHPTEQLLSEATSGRFDLVAVGSRGGGPVRRALLGSVSDHLARHAPAALVARRLDD